MRPLTFIILIVFLAPPLSAEQVSLVANTWPPYVDEHLPEGGLATELVRHIYQRAGYEADVSVENWSQAMEGAKIGAYHGLAAAWHSKEREQEYLYSRPYLVNELKLVKLRKQEGDYYMLNQLRASRVGVIRDYAYGIDFTAIPELQLVVSNHLLENVMNLLNGRVDFIVADERSIAQQVQEYLGERAKEIEYLDIELPSRSLYIAASRVGEGGEKRVDDFNRALVETLNDGSYREIVERWNFRYGIQR